MTIMRVPQDDDERFTLIREHLYTAVIGDILDSRGQRHCFLHPEIRPFQSNNILVGRAMPVLIRPAYGDVAKPFGDLTEALDSLMPGEVYLAHAQDVPCASWGEIMTTAARARGAVGAVIDGYHRDSRRLGSLDFSLYSRGAYGQDAGVRSTVDEYRVPLQFGCVRVEPGDLVVADDDGVVIVPRSVEDDVLEAAIAKVRTEDTVRAQIARGMLATQALDKYGVL